MFNSACCGFFGFVSFLGVLFYISCAVMVDRRNLVFLSHKCELDLFTMTHAEVSEKYWIIMSVAFVSH